jgi:Protein of unknown function (DUF3891)
MILRPLEPPSAAPPGYVAAWPVVERMQRQTCDRCWMITQPSHAALAGEIAASLAAPKFPRLDDELVRAIALHDAGWGPADAQAVTRSRASRPVAPRSFLAMEVAEILEAWTQSIQVAQSVGPAGGFIVSRHFHRIGERRIAAAEDTAGDRKKIEQFLAHEAQRQKRLTGKQQRGVDELESLTDLLQLCDLLSLYVCCGARESVEFPECCGVKVRLKPESQGYKLDPPVLEPGTQFAVAALRFPATRDKSGEELRISIL